MLDAEVPVPSILTSSKVDNLNYILLMVDFVRVIDSLIKARWSHSTKCQNNLSSEHSAEWRQLV